MIRESAEALPGADGRRRWRAAAWGVLGVLAAAWLALVEIFWLPLRVGGVLLPVSVLAAVAGNLLLVGQAHRLSGSRAVAVLPAATWLVIAVGAMVRRPEGDLILTGGGATGVVNLLFLLLGVTAAAVAAGRALAGPPRGGRRRLVRAEPAPGRSGRRTGGAR
ncbi:MAG: conserved rane protein of unknown function [Blastococcus sp.]|jgi:hypothetical protein|nr:conserved rane protein of unknown function [Blastococcus sp.]